ncbi:hypothetical protein [Vibrio parahaemolyticus]
MIKFSVIEGSSQCMALIHTPDGKFISSCDFEISSESKLIQIRDVVSRIDSETMLFQMMGAYASDKGYQITPHSDIKRNKRRHEPEVQVWNYMFKNSERFQTNPLDEISEVTPYQASIRCSYSIPCPEWIRNQVSVYSSDDMEDSVKRALSDSQTVREDVLNSSVTIFIEDDYPLPPANLDTAENTYTGYDLKQVVENYTSGKCMFLALALQERFGLDVRMCIDKYEDWIIEHAWAGSGSITVDANGIAENYKWEMSPSGSYYENVSKDQVFNLMLRSKIYPEFTEDLGEKAIRDAHKMIDNYLLMVEPGINNINVENNRNMVSSSLTL